MAPSIPLVAALFRIADASLDEQSMLQMPMLEQSIATEEGNSDCRCPGYFREQCEENAFQGCTWTSEDLGQHRLGWTDRGNSNEPWCQCDPDYVPTGGGPVHPVVPQPVPVVPQPAPTLPPPPPVPAQAPAAECPAGWEQKGDIGADIGGCGLQSCAERYDITSEAACAARCDGNSACVGFSYAPMNGDRNHAGVTACTIYNSDTPTGTWTGTEGIPTQVFCGRDDSACADQIDGGGWELVRHVPAGNQWHSATDQLRGTDVYGDSAGGALGSEEWSVAFPAAFNQFLFATGDCAKWLIASKDEVVGSFYQNDVPRQILSSSASAEPSQARWYRREPNAEDPWVSIIDHGAAIQSGDIVYGENSYGHSEGHGPHASNILPAHRGANVYVRRGPTADVQCAGRTAAGATSWVQYSADGIYLDVDTSQCGFQGVPVYFSSLGGNSHHWMTTGSSEIYEATATGFRVYIRQAGITTSQANGWDWHVNWIADGTGSETSAAANQIGDDRGVCSGQTASGTSNWVQYSADGIYLDVDTSQCGFQGVPVYISSLGGSSHHWMTTGSSELYHITATGFRVYINQPSITVAQANGWGWHVNWIGKGLEGQSEASAPCTGQTVSGSTNWVTYSADGIYLDVDTSACGFLVVPVYVTSVGGDSSHWESKGSSEIYTPTTNGFRMYIYKTGITPAQANSWGWNVNWVGSGSVA